MVIEVTNLQNNEILPHPLALLDGWIIGPETGASTAIIVQSIGNNDVPSNPNTWPIIGGRFKAFVLLHRGLNKIKLINKSTSVIINLLYEPPKTDRRVRLLYVVCPDDPDSGRFQGPPNESTSVKSATRRIVLGARLIQTFTSENMVRMHGLPRKTFRLDDHDDGACRPHVFNLRVSIKRARQMSQRDLWCLVRDTLASDSTVDHSKYKYVAFLSFTRYVYQDKGQELVMSHGDVLRSTMGHAALGGGGLALLGTGCLHTWAQHVSEIANRFTDITPINRRYLMDDSSYKGTRCGCYTTTLGAMCHELGHTFGLGHEVNGVMGMDFDDIHRAFVINESDQLDIIDKLKGSWTSKTFWDRSSAVWLSYHKWFNVTNPGDTGQGPKINNNQLEIRARHGVRMVVLLDDNRQVISHWEFTRGFGRTTFKVPVTLQSDGRIFTIKAMDNFGNIMETSSEHLNF